MPGLCLARRVSIMNMNHAFRVCLLVTVSSVSSLSAQTTTPVWDDRIDEGRELLAGDRGAGEALLKAEAARLEAAFAVKMRDAELIQRAGMAYFYIGDMESAQSAFARAIRLQPKNPGFLYMAGRLHAIGNRWVQAKLALEDSVKYDPKLFVSWMQLGRVYIELKQVESACSAFETATMLMPDDPKAHARLGEARMVKDDRSPDAAASFRRAIELDPADAVSWHNLGQLHQNRQEPVEALKAFTESAALRPDDWRAKAKLVQCYAALSDVVQRDAGIAELKSMHAAGKIKAELFCREQFVHNGAVVMAFESFKPAGDRAVRYSFRVQNGKGEPQYRISLGSSDAAAERVWRLDGDYPNDERQTFETFESEPDYERTRARVIDIIDGKLRAQ